jgi:hypothetical protein
MSINKLRGWFYGRNENDDRLIADVGIFFRALEGNGVRYSLFDDDEWIGLRGWFYGRIETAKALIADRALHDANRKHDFLATVAEVVNAAKSAIANNYGPDALLADLKLMADDDLAYFAAIFLKGRSSLADY